MDLILTVIPPPQEWDETKVERKAFEIANIVKLLDLSYLNIPEVIEEKTRGQRSVPYRLKVDNAKFGKMICSFTSDVIVILDKVVPVMPKPDFQEWLETHAPDFQHLVLVGGESSKIQYPGYHPVEAAPLAKSYFDHLYGITIFRRKNEVDRLIRKTQAGMEAFLSQIVFEANTAESVLHAYWKRCEELGLTPSKVFISVAPVSRKKDLEFLKWLGVYIPPETEAWLLEDERKMERKSMDLIESLVQRFRTFEGPVGLNVEHVMYNNLQVAAYMIHRIKVMETWNSTSH